MRINNPGITPAIDSSSTSEVNAREQAVKADNLAQPAAEVTRPVAAGVNVSKALRRAETGLRADMLRATARSSALRATAAPTLRDYQLEAEARISGAGSTREKRNAAITGAYADMFMENPVAFKWAGMAAHASFIVGTGMKLGRISPIIGSEIRQMLTEGNNAVFKDIFPVYLAYQKGGMAEVNRLAGTLSGSEFEAFRPMRDAFEKIDEGYQLYKSGKQAEGMELIWEGNADLLRHEQLTVLQNGAYNNHKFAATIASPAIYADFDDTAGIDGSTASFYWSRHSFKSIANPTERMKWIEGELTPIWRRQNEQEPDRVIKHMQTFIRLGTAAGGRY